MDEKSVEILKKLKQDSSKSVKRLAKELKLPRSTVYDKIIKMRDAGIIKQFTVVPDYEKLGTPLTVFILVKYASTGRSKQRNIASKIAKLPGVYEVHLIAGQWDLLVKARGKDMKEIGKITIDKLGEMEGVGERITCPCFSTVKEET